MRKTVLIVLFAAFLFTSCNGDKNQQREWIYDNLPQKLWYEQSTEIANSEYHRLVNVLEDHANSSIRRFQSAGIDKDIDEFMAISFLGLDDLYLLSGGSSSNERKRTAQIEKYKEQYQLVTNNLYNNFTTLLRLRDSTLSLKPSYSDQELCRLLLGKPDAISSPSAEEQMSIARSIMTNLFYNREHPSISSVVYDKNNKSWIVRLDNAPNQIVSFYKRDDGNYDIEWTGNNGFIPDYRQGDNQPSNYDEEDWGGIAEGEYISMSGYLKDDSGKKHEIDMEFYITGVADEDGSFGVHGSYHYKSQASDKRIELSGDSYDGQRGLSEIHLHSYGGTERFLLFLDRNENTITGDWYQYKDAQSCEKEDDNYIKRFEVSLR